MKIYLGSKSELKHEALKEAISFIKGKNLVSDEVKLITRDPNSGVPTTPNESETYTGAKNRAISIIDNIGDVFLGLESGLIRRESVMFEECWCVIVDNKKNEWIGISSSVQLPENVTTQLESGQSHVDSVNKIADKYGLSHKDTWGIYTKGVLPRSTSLFEAARNALITYFVKHDE
jgi:non-canonical (house-cleaning) NTP pyrophosphatase